MGRPSIVGFLKSLGKRLRISVRGCEGGDKLRLLVWSFMDSIPRSVRKAFPYLEEPLELIKNKLVYGTVLNVNGNFFVLSDCESLFILSPEFEDWMWSYLKPTKGEVFVDVGAHIGKYTIQIAKVVGESGLVVAIESHPKNYKVLLENIRLNGLKNVIPVNIAAWCSEGRVRLFIGDKNGHHSIKRDFGRGSLVVKARALDDVLEELRVEKVNWIKIDVEGAELEVLKGLQNTLRKYRPTVIAEITREHYEIEDLIRKLGYTLKNIAPTYYLLKPN